jgi:hypothetical protein
MAKLHLIDRWAPFTDQELLVLEGALDLVEAQAPVDHAPAAVESLSDEIGAEIQRRGASSSEDVEKRLRPVGRSHRWTIPSREGTL